MIDFLVAVLIIALIRISVSPIGAVIRWLYYRRKKPFKYYFYSSGNQNAGLGTLTLVLLFLVVWIIFF
jgi:NADH:ubiquinone oxidoreductase subunit 3 (subunit A)